MDATAFPQSPIVLRREAQGLTQYALAKKAGIDQSHLRKIETGEVAAPSVETAISIAKALGATVEELFAHSRAA